MPDRNGTADLAGLLRRCADGDEEALAALYDASCARVYRLSLLLTGHPEPAAHLCRITYLRVWREAGGYDARSGSAWAWLLARVHDVDRELAAAA
ncbi:MULTISPECIES: sigma factor [unclassified Nocardioides]|jgi:RNA polymerase sigma-70 factor (ECF subfamily)|uniref:sigma factor n=1 Tax=unclassified Nocardioides TaxID=2615069 RepID=UPI0007033D5E|nr:MULTISPECIES: sigma factor [unclassified Nocardioides]KRC56946.1 hypothetical protein ASE19_03850 [Nocardioides sp. Root79]KRC77155.1 hypothetical protein ASE20_02715 [Nocardioides sp. Root240]